jgi:hypothetical protein
MQELDGFGVAIRVGGDICKSVKRYCSLTSDDESSSSRNIPLSFEASNLPCLLVTYHSLTTEVRLPKPILALMT